MSDAMPGVAPAVVPGAMLGTMIPGMAAGAVPGTAPGAMASAAPAVGAAAANTTAGDAPGDAKVWQAAQNFEAMAIGQLLAPMFDTDDIAHSLFGGGDASRWRPMLVDAISKQIEARGGFGLAQPVYAAMLRAQEGRAQEAGGQQDGAPAGRPGRPRPRGATYPPRRPT